MFSTVITKNLNWENLTKNLITGMGLRMKNFNIIGKILFLRGFTKNQYMRGNFLKRGNLDNLQI